MNIKKFTFPGSYLLRMKLTKLRLTIILIFRKGNKMIDDKDIPSVRPPETPSGDEMMEKIKNNIKNTPLNQYPTIKPELNMYNIEETKDVLKSLCGLGNAVAASLADDGKITLSDYPKFIGPVISLPAAISGIQEVPKELADLTEQEKQELIDFVESELEVGEKAEEVTVRLLKIASDIQDFIKLIT